MQRTLSQITRWTDSKAVVGSRDKRDEVSVQVEKGPKGSQDSNSKPQEGVAATIQGER